MALNTIILQGRLTKDPDLRSTTTGKKVCSFTIAVDRGRNNGAYFIPCVAWETRGEFVNNYFLKGDPILVQGQLSTRQYDDKDGNKRTAYEVTVREVNFCGGKKEKESSGSNLDDLKHFPGVQWKDEPISDEDSLPF